ncbi:MAG: hypothetical protein KDK37_12975, partial [Leptospiraceae bacterium]|nr:hypothetical protein [Leptospiraceae bacterium]
MTEILIAIFFFDDASIFCDYLLASGHTVIAKMRLLRKILWQACKGEIRECTGSPLRRLQITLSGFVWPSGAQDRERIT